MKKKKIYFFNKTGIQKVSRHILRAGKPAVYAACRLSVYYSNSSLQSCFVVFFVGFDSINQGVLSDLYLLRRFLGDCIVILLSLHISYLACMLCFRICFLHIIINSINDIFWNSFIFHHIKIICIVVLNMITLIYKFYQHILFLNLLTWINLKKCPK